jgi:hypothetical protein
MADLGLEVDVGHRLILLHAEERGKARVRYDYTLVIRATEVVVLDIGADGAGDIRSAHKRTSGLVKELTELVGYGLGLHESTVSVGSSAALALKVLTKDLVSVLGETLNEGNHLAASIYKAGLESLNLINSLREAGLEGLNLYKGIGLGLGRGSLVYYLSSSLLNNRLRGGGRLGDLLSALALNSLSLGLGGHFCLSAGILGHILNAVYYVRLCRFKYYLL